MGRESGNVSFLSRSGATELSGGDSRLVPAGFAQCITAAPHRLYVVLAVRSDGKLLPQLADKYVDDLDPRFVHATIQIVEEHFLGERRALPQAQQLEHLILLAGKAHAGAADLDDLGVGLSGGIPRAG